MIPPPVLSHRLTCSTALRRWDHSPKTNEAAQSHHLIYPPMADWHSANASQKLANQVVGQSAAKQVVG